MPGAFWAGSSLDFPIFVAVHCGMRIRFTRYRLQAAVALELADRLLVISGPSLPGFAQLAHVVEEHRQFGCLADAARLPAKVPFKPLRQISHLVPVTIVREGGCVHAPNMLFVGFQSVACPVRIAL